MKTLLLILLLFPWLLLPGCSKNQKLGHGPDAAQKTTAVSVRESAPGKAVQDSTLNFLPYYHRRTLPYYPPYQKLRMPYDSILFHAPPDSGRLFDFYSPLRPLYKKELY